MGDINVLATAFKVQSALKSVGSDPMGGEANSVKGGDTDSLVTALQNSWLATIALAGIASGGENEGRILLTFTLGRPTPLHARNLRPLSRCGEYCF
jgi:hypothetical protein